MAPGQFPLSLLALSQDALAEAAGATPAIELGALLATDESTATPALPLALGRTSDGAPFRLDLARMPHLLVAGGMGSGTSTALRAMVTSLVYALPAGRLDLVLIDSARGTFARFAGLPHLRCPVIVDARSGVNAFGWAADEMERRYAYLQAAGARNISQYNARAEPLPYVVILMAELAELMTAAAEDVEWALTRLAQMSRAVGIHLVVATQHTSVGVITGLIKANLPARLAFRVPSSAASRVIVDTSGAEGLSEPGDMLFLGPVTAGTIRLRGAFVSDAEVDAITSYLMQRRPSSDDRRSLITEPWTRPARDAFDDELYDQAARLVVSTGDASIAALQRAFNLGFSRAARLVDRMRRDGLI